MGFLSSECPSCGEQIPRGAAFCPSCGAAAPAARFTCPHCGKRNKGSAKFCAYCGRPVAEEGPAAVDEYNRWRRQQDEFVRRIEVSELRGSGGRGLVIEPGSRALIFQGGEAVGTLEAGVYELTEEIEEPTGGFGRALRAIARIFRGNEPTPPTTAILMDSGDVTLTVGYAGLRTSEDAAVNVTFQVVVRLGDAQALHRNLMHGCESVSRQELEELLCSESTNVVQARLMQASIKDLYGNTELVGGLEAQLQQSIGNALADYGLELARIKFVDFHGDAYEEVRQARGEVFVDEQMAEQRERRAALNRRLRQTLTRERMDKFASGKDLEEFIRQREHELGLSNVVREAEMEELKRIYEEQRGDAEVARRHLLEKLELEHRGELLEERLRQREKETEASLAENRKKLELAFEARRKKQDIDLDGRRREQAIEQEARDAEFRRELEKIESLKAMSEEQILAMAADKSPEAARAIAERYRAEGAGNEEVRELYEKMLDRIERMHRDSMRAAAGNPARTPSCPHCGADVEPGNKFCAGCGQRLND